MIYFTSDWHLDHKNIIQYSNRPFNSVEEMNDTIINNCNEVVDVWDDLIFLGDFAFAKNLNRIKALRASIRCKHFHFIYGNHDKLIMANEEEMSEYFDIWGYHAEQRFVVGRGEKKLIVLNHCSFRTWNQAHYGSWNLYGHSHGSLQDDPNSLSFDVGVDTNNFRPYSLQDVERIMAGKTFKPIDHHAKRIRE